jgi:hypothetical protein
MMKLYSRESGCTRHYEKIKGAFGMAFGKVGSG